MNVRSFTYEGFDSRKAHVIEAFDAPKDHMPIPAPAPRPTFSTEEMELAKNLAREEGIREGQEQLKKQFEEEKNSAAALEAVAAKKMLEDINNKLVALHEESLSSRLKFTNRVGQLALAIAQKVCGDVSSEVIEKQITAIINESIARLDATDKIKISLNAKNAEHVNNKFTQATVSIDDSMQAGDFRLEWQNGFAERDVKKLWQVIGEICARQSSLEENEVETEVPASIEQTIKQGE